MERYLPMGPLALVVYLVGAPEADQVVVFLSFVIQYLVMAQ
ncbi:MAG: hypothetical protein BWY29_01049 [Microgenomates group bacterium ADurb.Bin238]|nr:MAG: hypothetical protein BWY29_01049 [Microgenomates group bacterium ADurb.Bin238]